MKNRKLRLISILLTLSLLLVGWKWATILVLELSNINYDLTEKVLRYFVLGGVSVMIVVGGVLFLKEYYEHK